MSGTATYRSFVGVAKETSKGTGLAPTDYLPVKSMEFEDVIGQLADTGMRGSMVEQYDVLAGVTHSEFAIGGDVFPDTFGFIIASLLGDVVTTGGSAPYSHAIAVKNSGDGQPVSLCFTDYDGVSARRWAGAQIAEVTVKLSPDGLLEFTAKGVGFASATTTTPSTSFTAVQPIPGWRATYSLTNPSHTSGLLLEAELTIKRNVAPIPNIDGTQAPLRVWAGAVAVTGKAKFAHDDAVELTRYLNATQSVLTLGLSQGSGAAQTDVSFVMSKLNTTKAKVERGDEFVTTTVEWTANANTTDAGASGGYSPIKVTLANAKASGTYS